MRTILENQFKLLYEVSKSCEPEWLESITNSMLNIYSTTNIIKSDFFIDNVDWIGVRHND